MTSLDDAERDLRAALIDGDPDWIARAERVVDEAENRERRAPVPLLAAALWYAEQGLRVFPLAAGSKIPTKGSRGCLDATADPAAIRRWWEATPEANVGLATGYLIDVVDIDGYAGQVARCANWEAFEKLTVLGIVSTPRDGGVHLYVPASGRGNKAGLFDHVDYRGVGGYVVAPPSRTDVGTYVWISPLNLKGAA